MRTGKMLLNWIYTKITRSGKLKLIAGVPLILALTWVFVHFNQEQIVDNPPVTVDWLTALKQTYKDFYTSSNYLIDNSNQTCIHPKPDLFDPSIMKFFNYVAPFKCATDKNWVYTADGYFYISADAVKLHGQITCVVTFLKRENDRTTVDDKKFENFTNGSLLIADFFKVYCQATDGTTYRNIHASIAKNQKTLDRLKKFDQDQKSSPNKGNILPGLGLDIFIMAFDSVSRMTFMRKLPKSFKYLTKVRKGIVLKGYNIVGDGTPQALIPILTAKTELELPETRKRMANSNFVDVYPFLFYKFRDNGYATTYTEDSPKFGTFTYRLKGFNVQPTDHYMIPFYVSAGNVFDFHPKYCLGSIPRHLVMINYGRDFWMMYKNHSRFAFIFHSELSHDDYNLIGAADDDLLNFLKYMFEGGYFDKTMFIMMGDHGHRFASIRATQQGKQEERMPMFMFVFPEWFEKAHSQAMKNFKINSNRLVSPFDIYSTLNDMLEFGGVGMGDVNNRSISLFKEIPKSRTCEQADIEPHWCACLNWETIPISDEIVKKAAEFILQRINDMTKDHRKVCTKLSLKKISNAVKYTPNVELIKFKQNKDHDGFVPDLTSNMQVTQVKYQVTMVTSPNDGLFESTLSYDLNNKSFKLRTEDISRINKFGKTAECVNNMYEQHLIKFCYCKT